MAVFNKIGGIRQKENKRIVTINVNLKKKKKLEKNKKKS